MPCHTSNRIMLRFVSILSGSAFSVLLLRIPAVFAWEVKTVFGITVSGGSGDNLAPFLQFADQVLMLVYGLASMSALAVITFGAYRYTSAGGDPKDVQEAKEIIKSAIYGLTLILLSYVFARLFGVFLGDENLFTNPSL